MPLTPDNIIEIILVISNVTVFLVQRTTIDNLKIRNKELEKTNKAAIDLSEQRGKDVGLFKDMYDPDYLKKYLEIKITVAVEKATSIQQANLDNEKTKEIIEHYEEALNFISFYMVAEKHYDRDKRISFIHVFFDKSKDLVWAVTNKKINDAKERMENDIKNSQNQLKKPDA